MQLQESLTHIGLELLAESKGTELSAGELTARLFPFIAEASRRMSTRAISDWLKQNHDVQISQPTISRALRNPKKYWQGFAEYIEPPARIVADGAKVTIEELLFPDPHAESEIFEDMIKVPSVAGSNREEEQAAYDEFRNACGFIWQTWFRIPASIRSNLKPYFQSADDEQEGQDNE